jgi:pimeloyl-ACP methyl ester carboxylesterase
MGVEDHHSSDPPHPEALANSSRFQASDQDGLELVHQPPASSTGLPPVLFVHGFNHAAWCWRHWMAAASADGFPAYALSLRGHGSSARPATRARLSTYVRDVLDVARSIPDGPVVLVGHSFGGLVVQYAISHYPARAAVLVAPIAARPALGTVLVVSRRKPLESLRLLAARPIRLGADLLFHAQPPAEAQLLVSQCETEPPLAQYQLLLHLPPKRPATTMPVLCVASTDDRVVPIGSARATARRYAAELAEYSGLGHDLMLDVEWRDPWPRISQWLQGPSAQ